MKKLLVILPCLLLCLIMVAVPVSAASVPLTTVEFSNGFCSVPPDQLGQGLYSLEFLVDDHEYYVSPVELVAVFNEPVRYEVPGFRYNGEQVYLIVEYDEDYMFDLKFGTIDYTVAVSGFMGVYEYTPPTPAGIFDVFGVLGAWIPVALGSLIGIFWTGSSLTFLGVLAVCALAFAVVFLIIAIIQRFLHFRG